MGMTVPQKKYFCNRIDEITEQKVNDLKNVSAQSNKALAQMGLANGEIQYPDDIKKVAKAIDLILGGKDNGWAGTSLGNIEIEPMLKGYSEFKAKMKDEITAENNDICNKRNAIYDEATRIKDVAMFGSEQAAHALLEEFVKWQQK